MSLRDWFAGMALSGFIVADEIARISIEKDEIAKLRSSTSEEFAKACYEQADAMLAEREEWTLNNTALVEPPEDR